jgi:hypothetical protein
MQRSTGTGRVIAGTANARKRVAAAEAPAALEKAR